MWYSYATIRVVPRVERGEFLNVGVVLFAREQGYLGACIELDDERLRGLAPDLDTAVVRRHLDTFRDICQGDTRGGPVAALPAPERFHWLVAPRSTILQTSPVHVGQSADPARTLEELMVSLVRTPTTQAPDAKPWPASDGAGT